MYDPRTTSATLARAAARRPDAASIDAPAQLAVVDTATMQAALVDLAAPGELTTIAGHQWTSPGGRYTFAAYEGGLNPGVAVIDHQDGHRVVQRLGYPGRPHGVDQGQ